MVLVVELAPVQNPNGVLFLASSGVVHVLEDAKSLGGGSLFGAVGHEEEARESEVVRSPRGQQPSLETIFLDQPLL